MKAAQRRSSTKLERTLGVALLFLAACTNKPSAATTSSASAAASAPPPPVAASGSAAAPKGSATPAADTMSTMFGTMETEKKSRPGVHPSVDDGFAAFTALGANVKEPKQSLGSTYKAAYCAHGVATGGDLAILLCEYADEAHAAVGGSEAKKLFANLTTRQAFTHKTLILVTNFQDPDVKPATTALQKKVVAAFNAL